MKFDLSKCIQGAPAWDLVLTIDGVDYPTRKPTGAAIQQLRNMQAVKVAEIAAMIFADPVPDVTNFSPDAMIAALCAYLIASNKHSAAVSNTVASAVIAQVKATAA